MTGLTALTIAALALAQQTDTTVTLAGATVLRMNVRAGTVAIATWDRPDVRVVAEHSARTNVEIHRGSATLTVDSRTRLGSGVVDYRITVPSTLDLSIMGGTTSITIEGANGAVQAETNEGDILIRGGRGTVRARSVAGTVEVEGTEGRVDIETIGRGSRVVNAGGEIYVVSVGSPIVLENLHAATVEASNVGGGIRFSGTLAPGGSYSFVTHDGPITIQVPATSSATFRVASVEGAISSDLPGAPAQFERGRRLSFGIGGGDATVEAETFNSRIRIDRTPGG